MIETTSSAFGLILRELACLSGLALAAADANHGQDYQQYMLGGGQSGGNSQNYQQYMDKYAAGGGQSAGNSPNYQQYMDNYASKYSGGGGSYGSFIDQYVGGGGHKDAPT
ncbi:MAG: hypothetical protein CMP96_05685, partial [Gammaproteobacteria bacterium]|nr:hypothetical protein [Gammaproteobacteria bacterium]